MNNNEQQNLSNIRFEDRVSENPNRRKIKIVSQTADTIIADIEYADTVQGNQDGSPLNADVLNQFTQSVITSENNSTNALEIANAAKTAADDAVERIAKVQGTNVHINDEFVTDFYVNGEIEEKTLNIDNYLKKAGGEMTGCIKIAQGDGNGINIGDNGFIDTSENRSILGKWDEEVKVGHQSLPLKLRGNQNRPQYTSDGTNYKELATKEDSNTSPFKFINLPSYQEIEPTHTTNLYLKEALKWICSNYPNLDGVVFCGVAKPNSQGIYQVHIYNTSNVNSEGLPQYCSGFYTTIGNELLVFSTHEYNFKVKYVAEQNTDVTFNSINLTD